jgi:hypothetical protein
MGKLPKNENFICPNELSLQFRHQRISMASRLAPDPINLSALSRNYKLSREKVAIHDSCAAVPFFLSPTLRHKGAYTEPPRRSPQVAVGWLAGALQRKRANTYILQHKAKQILVLLSLFAPNSQLGGGFLPAK